MTAENSSEKKHDPRSSMRVTISSDKSAVLAQSEQIRFIKEELQKGKNKKQVFDEVLKKWNLTRGTFNSLYLAANVLVLEEEKILEEQIRKDLMEKQKALAKQILSIEERKVLLSEIARGTVRYHKTVKVPSPNINKGQIVVFEATIADRISAISELNKMENLYENERRNVVKDNRLEIKIIIPDTPQKNDSKQVKGEYQVLDIDNVKSSDSVKESDKTANLDGNQISD